MCLYHATNCVGINSANTSVLVEDWDLMLHTQADALSELHVGIHDLHV